MDGVCGRREPTQGCRMDLKDRKKARDRNSFVQNGEEEAEKDGSLCEHPVSVHWESQCKRR